MSKVEIDELVQWMELMNECRENDISVETVREFVKSQKKPQQLMARIYNDKFQEDEY